MRKDPVVLAALTACFLLWPADTSHAAEQVPPTPHAQPSGSTAGPTPAPAPRPAPAPGGKIAPPTGAAPTAEPAQATDVPPAENASLVAADLALLKELHEENQNEIAMGKLAQERGAASRTKALGRKLVADHAAADKKIAAYLKRKKLDMSILVAVKGSAAAEHDLAGKSGADFDKAFSAMMVDGHTKTIEKVTTARGNTSDRQLKALLGSLLPPLQQHLKMAQAAAGKGAESI